MIDHETIGLLLKGINNVTWQSLVMIGVSFALMYLAIVKDYEPLLLLPIAAGCMLANLPLSPLVAEDGMLKVLYNMGVVNEMYPLLIFIGIGALTDFGPLLENPKDVYKRQLVIAPAAASSDSASVVLPAAPWPTRATVRRLTVVF